MKYCPSCGEKIEEHVQGHVDVFYCPHCGDKHYMYHLGDEDLVEYFIDSPVTIFQRVNSFRKSMESKFQSIAQDIEGSLENNMLGSGGNSLAIKGIYLNEGRPLNSGEQRTEVLIAKGLIAYSKKNEINLGKILDEAIQKHSEEDKDSKALEVIERVERNLVGSVSKSYKKVVETSRYGAYSSSFGTISVDVISRDIAEESNIPKILKPLIGDTSEVGVVEENVLDSVICHELTHAWLDENTQKSREDIPRTLDETFTKYINIVFGRDRYENKTGDSESYPRPGLLTWGIKILEQKFERLEMRGLRHDSMYDRIDFTRDMQVKVYEHASGAIGADFKKFLRFSLFKEDKKRMTQLRELDKEFDKAFGGTYHLLFGDALGAIDNQELVEEIEDLKQRIDWDNPKKIEKRILEDLIDEAVESDETYGDLCWVNERITEELRKEYEILREYIEMFEKVRRDVRSEEFSMHLRQHEEELGNIENKIESMIKEGDVDKSKLPC